MLLAWRFMKSSLQVKPSQAIEVCDICGKKVKVIACIEDPVVIKKILTHLKEQTPDTIKYVMPECRSPAQSRLFVVVKLFLYRQLRVNLTLSVR